MYEKFLVAEGKDKLEWFGTPIEVIGLEYKRQQRIYRKDKKMLFIVPIWDENKIPPKILKRDNVKIYDIAEYNEFLESVKELTYYIYSEVLLEKSLEKIDLPEINLEAGEQERLKTLCEAGVWGIKYRDNLPRLQDRLEVIE